MSKRVLWLLFFTLLATAAWLKYNLQDNPRHVRPLPPFSATSRPLENRYLFDYAGILEHYQEGTDRYLERIRERYDIEALVLTVPELGAANSIEALAVDLVNAWRIGGANQGRGLLLLLSNREQKVKLEVTYDLEDVFTDAFVGYIEDLQLQAYFNEGDIGTGLVAVMEEIERRAQIKQQDLYTPQSISSIDQQLLSGGAGAKRNLQDYAKLSPGESGSIESSGAASPQEAWQVMLAKWSGKGAHIDKNIYTDMTRMAMGDPDKPDKRTRKATGEWLHAEYEVIGAADHAVIWFTEDQGWNSAPFLFCRTSQGWKFDIVSQRRLVVMTENPHWKVELADTPYSALLGRAKQSTGKDLPLAPEDIYRCRDDAMIARRIISLERARGENPADFDTVMQLARLNVITGRRPNHVTPLLQEAKRLNPGSPEPYRYSAIYNVNAFFQYRTALDETRELLKRSPNDHFGHNMLGFLHYRLGEYRQSLDSLQRALAIDSEDVYALVLLARNYSLLYKQANPVGPRRKGYGKSALLMLSRAEEVAGEDAQRIAALKQWMSGWGIL